MQLEVLIPLVSLGVVALSGVIGIVVAIIRGDMKKFIEEAMIEAEKTGMSGAEKLKYVLLKVKEKYKILEVFMNVKKFIERIIELSKNINAK